MHDAARLARTDPPELETPRILIAILEMNQTSNGSVNVPKALRPYMGGMETIE